MTETRDTMARPSEPRNHCQFLLIALVLLILAMPFAAERESAARIALAVAALAVPLAGVWAMRAHRRQFVTAAVLGGGAFLAALWHAVDDSRWSIYLVSVLTIAFYGFTAASVLRYVLRKGDVTYDKVMGLACVYLLIGATWTQVYVLLIRLDPGSFSFPPGAPVQSDRIWVDLLYYSFATLTTLGYGDITPLSRYARAISLLEAVTGVLYIAMLVARMVGLYAASVRLHRSTEGSDNEHVNRKRHR